MYNSLQNFNEFGAKKTEKLMNPYCCIKQLHMLKLY